MSDISLTPYQVVSTPVFDRSLSKLRNRRVKMQIIERLFCIENEGFFGDINSVGGVEHIKQAFLVAEKARAKLDKENNEISLNDLIASAIAKVMTNQKSVQFS
ncbi:Uncharacterised protein [Moraxella caprae]|uniref:Uncharacterized protein n=1 Tax=Moraxella caprae TaxID=90240 RepID=A0A378R2U8_9GAMM|nr:hypothetical protein [Moraxella caprae]STZ08190.1 Uncharacterised protein [Moraxella caprae]